MTNLTNTPIYLPGLIPGQYDPGQWRVEHVEVSQSCVILQSREAHLPAVVTRQDWLAAQHEHAHVAHSWVYGSQTPRATEFSIKLQEPVIETISSERGLSIFEARDHLDWSQRPPLTTAYDAAHEVIQLATSYHASQNLAIRDRYHDAANVLSKLAPLHADTVHNAVATTVKVATQYARGQIPHAALRARVDDLAELLARTFPPPPSQPKEKTPEQQQAEQEAQEEAQERAENEQLAAKQESDLKQELGQEEGGPTELKTKRNATAEFTIHRHVTARRAGQQIAAGERPTTSSGPLKYPRRFLDGRIFSRSSVGAGILLDGSGSNQFAVTAFAALIKRIPNLWLGVHTGYNCSCPNKYSSSTHEHARLCVIAENGRFGWYEQYEDGNSGGNHGSDLPALRYMVQHAVPPYVWVSDGEAWTDVYDEQQYISSINRLCRRNYIVRVDSAELALRFLKGETVAGQLGANDYITQRQSLPTPQSGMFRRH